MMREGDVMNEVADEDIHINLVSDRGSNINMVS